MIFTPKIHPKSHVFQPLEASQHPDGYYLATVSFPSLEPAETEAAAMEEELQQLLRDLRDWQVGSGEMGKSMAIIHPYDQYIIHLCNNPW